MQSLDEGMTHSACPQCRDGRCHCHYCSEHREAKLQKELQGLRDLLTASQREVERLQNEGGKQ